MLTARPLSDGTTGAGASARLGIAIRRAAENVIVSMHGQLTVASRTGIEHLLADLIRDQGNLHLVIDVEEVTVVDSHGLAVLHEARRLALQCGATLTIRNPPDSIRKDLEARSADRGGAESGGRSG